MSNNIDNNKVTSHWDEVDKALLDAVKDGNFVEVEELLACGADINVQDEKGWSPLMYAAASQNVKITQILMDNGANTELRGKNGEKAIYLAKTGPAMGVIFNGLKERYQKQRMEREKLSQNNSNTLEL